MYPTEPEDVPTPEPIVGLQSEDMDKFPIRLVCIAEADDVNY